METARQARNVDPAEEGVGDIVVDTPIPPPRRSVRVEAEIPDEAVAEFELMMLELMAGKRDRALSLERDRATIQALAVAALERVVTAIRTHPGTGQGGGS